MPVTLVTEKKPQPIKKGHTLYDDAHAFMLQNLHESGLDVHHIRAYPAVWHGMGGYVLPYQDDYWRFRIHPQYNERLRGKYRGPARMVPRLYFPWGLLENAWRNAATKYVCEGEKKAAALYQRFKIPVAAIGGCNMWSDPGSRSSKLLPQMQDLLKSRDRVVYIADSDVETKWTISRAALMFKSCLLRVCTSASIIYPPAGHKGADDWLVNNKGADDVGELEHWPMHEGVTATLEELQEKGCRFKVPKEGEQLSLKHIHHDVHTTRILAKLILERLTGWLSYDQHLGMMVEGEMSQDMDMAVTMLECEVNAYFPGVKPSRQAIRSAILEHIKDLPRQSVIADYISSITWDGVPRLDTWLPDLFETTNPNAGRIGRLVMCGYYSRLMDPGSKFDHMLILKGRQGIGKSTAFEIMGTWPMHNGHVSMSVEDLAKKDTTGYNKRRIATVINVDDMEQLKFKEQGKLKSMITTREEESRMMYTEHMLQNKMACIYVASTNQDFILSDTTGLRRFLPVHVTKVKLRGQPYIWSTQIRDQILAEVAVRWRDIKDTWWDEFTIDELNMNAMTSANASPLEEVLEEMLGNDVAIKFEGQTWVTTTAIMAMAGDPQWTPNSIGRRLKFIREHPASIISVGERRFVLVKSFLANVPERQAALFKPLRDVEKIWVYPVKMNEKMKRN